MRPFMPGAAASAANKRWARDEAAAATTLAAATCLTAERREMEVFIDLSVLPRIQRTGRATSNRNSRFSQVGVQASQTPGVLVISGLEQVRRALLADQCSRR